MIFLRERANNITLCVFELLVGALLLINPVGFTAGIITLAGVMLIVVGVVGIVRYFRMSPEEAALGQSFVWGLAAVLAGAFCVWKAEWFIMTFSVLTILYGLVILAAGISKLQLMLDMIRQHRRNWLWSAVNAAISILCAVIILKNPFTTTEILWMFIGGVMLVEGLLDLILLFIGRKISD